MIVTQLHYYSIDGGLIAMAMNQRPLLRAAYDRALEKYDGLIMPTIPSVARKVPPANSSVLSFLGEAFSNTQNTGMQNLSGHPAISLPVGKVLPEDEEVSHALHLLSCHILFELNVTHICHATSVPNILQLVVLCS